MENLDWLFPSWKKLAEHYKETWTVETLHFYSNQDANKTYFMLKDAGYKCAVELNYNCASFVWVWVPKNKLKFFPRATFYPKGNMTLTEKINSNPYLKASNCTDLTDVNYAIESVKELLKQHDSNRLRSIYASLMNKKEKMEAKASNLHPVFLQALSPFGIR